MKKKLRRPIALFGSGLAALSAAGVLTMGATLSLFSDSDTSATNTSLIG